MAGGHRGALCAPIHLALPQESKERLDRRNPGLLLNDRATYDTGFAHKEDAEANPNTIQAIAAQRETLSRLLVSLGIP